MKKTFVILLFSLLHLSSWAEVNDITARKVLDQTAARLEKAGGIAIKFTALTLIGKQTQGSMSGSMQIQGRKFHMSSTEMLTWFDGKTQWSMQAGDTEVSLTEPTGMELQAINPYAFLGIYKQGFDYKMKKGKLSNGQKGYKLFLTANNGAQEIREIYLEIDNNYNPIRVSMRQGRNQWIRIVINSLQTGKKFPDSSFTFPKDRYPNVDIIDLR